MCSNISDGDDHIAIKGSSSTGVTNLTIAHNHLEAGHGISIGSEFTGGVSGIKVYDISIDQIGTGTGGGSSNGLRIKSDSSRGGLVNNVTYSDICMRGVANPILLTPIYSSATGSDIPHYTNITFSNIHVLTGGNSPTVTLDGYSASHINSVTLDNVVFDPTPKVTASYTNVTLGPGNVSFTPSGTGVTVTNKISGSSTPEPLHQQVGDFLARADGPGQPPAGAKLNGYETIARPPWSGDGNSQRLTALTTQLSTAATPSDELCTTDVSTRPVGAIANWTTMRPESAGRLRRACS